ncbi:hypothetical protein IMY05_C4573000400 [Salix suchowensis]|nr:hypothetical protein IMY05_C4573000400 [Salix suchowensis]
MTRTIHLRKHASQKNARRRRKRTRSRPTASRKRPKGQLADTSKVKPKNKSAVVNDEPDPPAKKPLKPKIRSGDGGGYVRGSTSPKTTEESAHGPRTRPLRSLPQLSITNPSSFQETFQVEETSAGGGYVRGPSTARKRPKSQPADGNRAKPEKKSALPRTNPKGRRFKGILVQVLSNQTRRKIPSSKVLKENTAKENTADKNLPLKAANKPAKTKLTSFRAETRLQRQKAKPLPKVILERIQRSLNESHEVDDEPDPIDFLSTGIGKLFQSSLPLSRRKAQSTWRRISRRSQQSQTRATEAVFSVVSGEVPGPRTYPPPAGGFKLWTEHFLRQCAVDENPRVVTKTLQRKSVNSEECTHGETVLPTPFSARRREQNLVSYLSYPCCERHSVSQYRRPTKSNSDRTTGPHDRPFLRTTMLNIVYSVLSLPLLVYCSAKLLGSEKTPNPFVRGYVLRNKVTHQRLLPIPSSHRFVYPTVCLLVSLSALEKGALDVGRGGFWIWRYLRAIDGASPGTLPDHRQQQLERALDHP